MENTEHSDESDDNDNDDDEVGDDRERAYNRRCTSSRLRMQAARCDRALSAGQHQPGPASHE